MSGYQIVASQMRTEMRLFFTSAMLIAVASVAMAQQPTKVGYANIDYIISKLPEFASLQEQLKGTQADLQADYSKRRQEFQQKYQAYAQQGQSTPDSTRQRLEAELQQLSANLQNFEEDAQRVYENAQKLVLAPLYLRVNNAIRNVARANGFAIILNAAGKTILFAGEQEDISDKVIAHLTEEVKED